MKAKMVWLLSVACWSGIDFSLGEMLLRVADYNIKFLSVEDLDAKPQRKQRLKTVIEQLKPDILALQEIKDRQALEQLFDSDEWSILIDDDSNDAQDLAIVVRRPLKFKDRTDLDADDADFLFPGPTFENLFRNRRDVLVGVVEIPGETEPLHVHEKSRLGGRAVTDSIREGAARALVQKLDRDYEDKRFILLGDFNDNPDDKSLNILETGSIDAQGGAEEDDGAFLSNPAEDLVALDKVSHGKSAADINPQTGRIDLVTAGSRARNNDNRGNDTNTGDILFDQILFPAILRSLYVDNSFQIFDAGVAIEGTGGQNGDQASDHLPVYADFVFGRPGGGSLRPEFLFHSLKSARAAVTSPTTGLGNVCRMRTMRGRFGYCTSSTVAEIYSKPPLNGPFGGFCMIKALSLQLMLALAKSVADLILVR